MRSVFLAFLLAALPLCAELRLESGQGQLVFEQFPSAPLAVRAVDAAGRPIPDLPITWTVTEGQGSIIRGSGERTDSNGYAAVRFVGTDIQPGTSWAANTITASSSSGVLIFTVTTVQSRAGTGPAPQPSVQLVAPASLSGPAGSTIQDAFFIQVVAAAGIRLGQGIPNVGVRLVLGENADPETAPFGTCQAPGGFLMTDSRGVATCHLVLNRNVGLGGFSANVGEILLTRGIALEITPGAACTITLTSSTRNFAAAGGTGSATVSAAQGCAWTAASTVPWMTISGTPSGTGSGTFNFTVAPNSGAARTGTISVGNQSLSISQSSASTPGGPLAFTVGPALPGASVGQAYSVALTATGGTPPYTWAASQLLPIGLSLNATTGVLSGAPTTAGNYNIYITVADAANNVLRDRLFTLTVSAGGGPGPGPGGPLVITTTSFPNGSVGVPYSSPASAAGGCQNPFSGGPTFTVVSGSLPTGLTLQSASNGATVAGTPTVQGDFTFTLRAADSCGAATTRSYTLRIGAAPVGDVLTVAPGTLSFAATVGAATLLEQTIRVETGSTSGVAYSVFASSDDNWLSVSPVNGSTPSNVVVRVSNYNALPVGTRNGQLTVISQALETPVTIPVTLTITSSQPGAPTLAVTPATIALSPTATEQSVRVESTIAGTAFSVSATSSGNWLAVTPTNGVTPTNITVRASGWGGLPAGTYTGSVTVAAQASNSPVTIPVTLTIPVSPGPTVSPSAISFEHALGAALPSAQTISINTSAPQTFTVVPATRSGGQWLSISTASVLSPGTVQVMANPQGLSPGTYQGSVSITPAGGQSPVVVEVTLRVVQSGPVISSITNGASFQPGAISPGEILTIFGTNLGPQALVTLRLDPAGNIESSLANTRVWFDEQLAPLIHTSSTQVTMVVPYSVAGKPNVRVQVEYNGASSEVKFVPVAASAPGLFTVGGSTQGAIINQDGTVNSPHNGAPAGSIVSLFGTGEGQITPAVPEGSIAGATNLARPLLQVSATVGGRDAEVVYAGSAPGMPIGLFQVNVRIPVDVTAGAAPVVLRVGEASSQSGVTVSVRQ